MSICPAKSLFNRSHRFEARYDLSAARPLPEIFGEGMDFSGNVSGVVEMSRSKTYVHDICVCRGAVVKRGA